MSLSIVTLFPIFLIAAAVFIMLGLGGGAIYTPLQVIWEIDFQIAATTSLFLIVINSASATTVYRKAKRIDWLLVLILELAMGLGSFLGGLFSSTFSFKFLADLYSASVGLAGIISLLDAVSERTPDVHLGFPYLTRRLGDQTFSVNLAIIIPFCLLIGTVAALIGIGGGALLVPTLVILCSVPIDIAIGCSVVMIGITASVGFIGHVISGHWDWQTSLFLAVAVLIGGQIGARLSLKTKEAHLKRFLGWMLISLATLMAWKAYG